MNVKIATGVRNRADIVKSAPELISASDYESHFQPPAVHPGRGFTHTSMTSMPAHATFGSALAVPEAAPVRAAAALLPRALAGRHFGPAWTIAIVVHLALVAAVALTPLAPPAQEDPPIRLVFHDPPPPPPPAGAPAAVGAAPVVEPERPIVPPKPVEPRRLVRAERRAAKPRPVERVVQPAPAPAAVGVVEGTAAGVAGGTAGGIAGGVVGGAGTQPVPVAQVAQPPVLVRRVAPVYPRDARRREITGLVLLQAVLDRDGQVERDVRVLESVPMLDDEAVAAVRQWRFRPARNERGEPLRVILEIPIRFTLN
jgi:protein TonB